MLWGQFGNFVEHKKCGILEFSDFLFSLKNQISQRFFRFFGFFIEKLYFSKFQKWNFQMILTFLLFDIRKRYQVLKWCKISCWFHFYHLEIHKTKSSGRQMINAQILLLSTFSISLFGINLVAKLKTCLLNAMATTLEKLDSKSYGKPCLSVPDKVKDPEPFFDAWNIQLHIIWSTFQSCLWLF